MIRLIEKSNTSKEIVMAYIGALDSHQFEKAAELIDEKVKISGPAGEGFGKPTDFINMLKRYSGKYDIRKIFVDGDDVCLLYDFHTSGKSVYMSSWYRVHNGKIYFIKTVFDPAAFSQSEEKGVQ